MKKWDTYGNLTIEHIKKKVLLAINLFITLLLLWILRVFGIKLLLESESLLHIHSYKQGLSKEKQNSIELMEAVIIGNSICSFLNYKDNDKWQ